LPRSKNGHGYGFRRGFDTLQGVVAKAFNVFDQLSTLVGGVLPAELGEEARKSVQTALRSACERLDLVTLEEFEVQQAVLQRTREKVERLEREVAALEAQIKGG
jgi:BMFP domain-containing protein YqiC